MLLPVTLTIKTSPSLQPNATISLSKGCVSSTKMQCFPKLIFLVVLHFASRITRFPISSPDITLSSLAFDHDTAFTLHRYEK